jgi:hypothetical protein
VNVTNTNLAWIDAVVADEGVDIMTVATYSGGGGSGGGSSSPNQPTFAVGQVDVASPGTAERLPAKAVPSGFSVVVRAKPGNTGSIWVGPDAATAEDHDVAYELQSGDFVEYFVTNVNEIFIDADVDDEGVCWTVEAA